MFTFSSNIPKSLKKDFKDLRNQESKITPRFSFDLDDLHLIENEKTKQTDFDRHYIYHTAWAARILKDAEVKKHIDISSALYFSTIISAFLEVEFYDYRPPNLELDNLNCGHLDLSNVTIDTETVNSLSCMHVVEHIGLGRYGDPIDYDGDLKAVAELKRILAKNGILLFVVPIGGIARICFNAHRIYTYQQVVEMFMELTLEEFALIPANPKNGHLIRNASEKEANSESYGCGCFYFRKSC